MEEIIVPLLSFCCFAKMIFIFRKRFSISAKATPLNNLILTSEWLHTPFISWETFAVKVKAVIKVAIKRPNPNLLAINFFFHH